MSYFDNFNLLCSCIPKRGPIFWPSLLKWLKGQKYFYGHFILLWPYLLTTKLRCLQKNYIGHTKQHSMITVVEFKAKQIAEHDDWLVYRRICSIMEQIFQQILSFKFPDFCHFWHLLKLIQRVFNEKIIGLEFIHSLYSLA